MYFPVEGIYILSCPNGQERKNNMKILNRSLSIILIVAMAAALLTGCGSTSQAPAEQKPAETKPAESQQPAAETAKPQEPAKNEEPAKTESSEKTADPTPVNVGVLKGPTGMGAVKLMDDSENGVYPDYHFTLTAEPTDIVARLTNGELNIGALPTNVASNLYNKTNGAVRVIALNCLGVLCVLENGETVKTPADLKGRTIWCNGQGSNPEYMINYIVRKSGLEPGKDVDIQFGDPGEISAKMVSGEIDLCMLPVPAATAVLVKNQDVRKALDVAEEYEKAAADGSVLTMGCLAARTDFIEEHPEAVAEFVEAYARTIEFVKENPDEAAELVAKYEITGNAQIAKKALPDAGIVCITGEDIRPALEGYLKVMFEANPASIGGAMPGDDFYWPGK